MVILVIISISGVSNFSTKTEETNAQQGKKTDLHIWPYQSGEHHFQSIYHIWLCNILNTYIVTNIGKLAMQK